MLFKSHLMKYKKILCNVIERKRNCNQDGNTIWIKVNNNLTDLEEVFIKERNEVERCSE